MEMMLNETEQLIILLIRYNITFVYRDDLIMMYPDKVFGFIDITDWDCLKLENWVRDNKDD